MSLQRKRDTRRSRGATEKGWSTFWESRNCSTKHGANNTFQLHVTMKALTSIARAVRFSSWMRCTLFVFTANCIDLHRTVISLFLKCMCITMMYFFIYFHSTVVVFLLKVFFCKCLHALTCVSPSAFLRLHCTEYRWRNSLPEHHPVGRLACLDLWRACTEGPTPRAFPT